MTPPSSHSVSDYVRAWQADLPQLEPEVRSPRSLRAHADHLPRLERESLSIGGRWRQFVVASDLGPYRRKLRCAELTIERIRMEQHLPLVRDRLFSAFGDQLTELYQLTRSRARLARVALGKNPSLYFHPLYRLRYVYPLETGIVVGLIVYAIGLLYLSQRFDEPQNHQPTQAGYGEGLK